MVVDFFIVVVSSASFEYSLAGAREHRVSFIRVFDVEPAYYVSCFFPAGEKQRFIVSIALTGILDIESDEPVELD
jgi:hypothetical protein